MANRFLVVFSAPHRLPFLTGTLGLTAIAAWWVVHLAGLSPQGGDLPARLLHAPAMLLIVYPAFIFGFLLTVFPRWMSQAELSMRQCGIVSSELALGTSAVAFGLWTDWLAPLQTGLVIFSAAWAFALFLLGATIRRNAKTGKPPCWHAVSAFAGLIIGLLALVLVMRFNSTMDPRPLRLANILAFNGFVLPVFLTVAHRMVPFFAGSAVKGYKLWRPGWLLVALWALLLARGLGEALMVPGLSASASAGLTVLTGLMIWKWWPRSATPGLLKVLLWGFIWAPVGFALSVLATLGLPIGLAPTHALALGFGMSLLVAMVTRVTHGHSGRPLAMAPAAWLAFITVQLATVLRIATALKGETQFLLAITALVLIAGLIAWLARNAWIYIRPRLDGRPG